MSKGEIKQELVAICYSFYTNNQRKIFRSDGLNFFETEKIRENKRKLEEMEP